MIGVEILNLTDRGLEPSTDLAQRGTTLSSTRVPMSIGDRRSEGNALDNLANAYSALGQTRRAIKFYEQRLEIAREIGDRRGEAKSLNNLGNIASAKGEILEGLSPEGRYFFNADDPRLCSLASGYGGEKISFGLDHPADIRISNYQFKNLEEMSFDIELEEEHFSATASFVGRHFLYNIAAAVAVAARFGLSSDEIIEGISRLKVPSMRGRILRFSRGNEDPITVWDDSYNSSPLALNAVLETVGEMGGFRRKILALGEMLELGPQAVELHRQAGHSVARSSADYLVTVGEGGSYIGQGAREKGFPPEKIIHFESSQEAADFLIEQLAPGEFLLVKGSRGVAMDRVVRRLEERGEG